MKNLIIFLIITFLGLSVKAQIIVQKKELPSQTGQAGKILGTNGTSPSWIAIPTGTGGAITQSFTAGTNVSINQLGYSYTISSVSPTISVVNATLSGSYPTQTLTIPTSSTTILTATTNVTVSGSAPNYTIGSVTPTLSVSGATLSGSYPTQTLTIVDTDTDSQTLSLSTNTLSISGGNSVTLPTYNQTLSISGQNLSISNGNSITIPTNSTTLVAGNNVSLSNSGLTYTVNSVTPTLSVVNGSLTGSYPTQTLTIPAAGDVTTTATQTLTNKTYSAAVLTGTSTAQTLSITGVTTASNVVLNGYLNENKAADAASSSTVDLGALSGNLAHITGTTTITSFGTAQAGTRRIIVFDGSLTLAYNATSLILPGATNIQTAANDIAVFVSEGSGNWRCVSYQTASEAYTNYTPTVTGFSSNPTFSAGTARWKMISRNTCHVIIYPDATGTSNSTGCTVTLPFNAANIGINGQSSMIPVTNSGSNTTGTIKTRLNSNIADVYFGAFGNFTASGTKAFYINITYQIEQ